jgi:hypothetical protein
MSTKDISQPAAPPNARRSSVSTEQDARITPQNVFGLSRKFFGKKMPLDDPEADLIPEDLSDIPVCPNDFPSPSQPFYPFPNRSAFVMGDWFWNGGVQNF